jgi:hypothetical protein
MELTENVDSGEAGSVFLRTSVPGPFFPIQALKSLFPPEALSADTSRGFELTSIKAAFVVERLNEVFGSYGVDWRYAHSPFEELQAENGRMEIVTEAAFQYRFKATNDYVGCAPAVWDAGKGDWAFRNAPSTCSGVSSSGPLTIHVIPHTL